MPIIDLNGNYFFSLLSIFFYFLNQIAFSFPPKNYDIKSFDFFHTPENK